MFFAADGFHLRVIVDVIFAISFLAYYINAAVKKQRVTSHGEFQQRFIRVGKALAVLVFLSVIVSIFSPASVNAVLVWCLVYFISGIIAMCIQRHEEGNHHKLDFAALHFVPGVIFIMAAIFMSYPAIFPAILNVLRVIFIVIPVELFTRLLSPLFSRLPLDYIEFTMPSPPTTDGGGRGEIVSQIHETIRILTPFRDSGVIMVSTILFLLFGAFVLGLFGIFIVRGLKMLFSHFGRDMRSVDTNTGIETISSEFHLGNWFSQIRGGNAVRRYYRKFLKLCIEKDIAWGRDSTSAAIARNVKRQFGNFEDVDALREVYIRVRYGGIDVKEDAAKAKHAYAGVKKAMHNG